MLQSSTSKTKPPCKIQNLQPLAKAKLYVSKQRSWAGREPGSLLKLGEQIWSKWSPGKNASFSIADHDQKPFLKFCESLKGGKAKRSSLHGICRKSPSESLGLFECSSLHGICRKVRVKVWVYLNVLRVTMCNLNLGSWISWISWMLRSDARDGGETQKRATRGRALRDEFWGTSCGCAARRGQEITRHAMIICDQRPPGGHKEALSV